MNFDQVIKLLCVSKNNFIATIKFKVIYKFAKHSFQTQTIFYSLNKTATGFMDYFARN